MIKRIKVELDKSESRTDWIARPLSEKQCVWISGRNSLVGICWKAMA